MKVETLPNSEALSPAKGPEIRKLVNQRMSVLFGAWMTKIGHKRPGTAGGPGAKPGPTIEQATESAASITKQIEALMAAKL